jgi:hypothetical protein
MAGTLACRSCTNNPNADTPPVVRTNTVTATDKVLITRNGGKGMSFKSFDIYFSDLNEEAQKELLELVGATDPSDMNWDIDMCPIAIYETEVEVSDNG